MQRHDPVIYPGTFASGVFNPDCRRWNAGYVAPTMDNLAALRREHDQITEELAARAGLPPLLAHRLHSRWDQITQFLDRHTLETA